MSLSENLNINNIDQNNFWHPKYENGQIIFDLQGLLDNSFFYAAAGLDFAQVDYNKHSINSFIMVDYNCTRENIVSIASKKSLIENYKLIFEQDVLQDNEVIFGRTSEFLIKILERRFASSPPAYFEWLKSDMKKSPFFNVTDLKQIGIEDTTDDFFKKSWGAIWFVYKKTIDNDKLPEYISVVYISADAVCAYKGLFTDYRKAPLTLAIIQYGSSFGGAYTRLGDEDSIFGDLVLNADIRPKTLICGVTTNYDSNGEKEQFFSNYYDSYKGSYTCGGNNCYVWGLNNLKNTKHILKLVPEHQIAPLSSALYAAIEALIYIRENPKLIEGKSPKQAIKEWLKENYIKYELVNSKCEPSENIIEAIAIVVNWRRSGGANPTLINRNN